MPIVTFWNADREQSGVSISTVAVATKMAIERNLKVLIVSAAYNDSTIKNCFWKENAVRKQIMTDRSSSIAIENGVEGLSRLIASNKIEPENITDYTHVIFKDTLEVLDGYMENPTKTKEENLRDYKTISAVYPAILNVANQYYDMVLVDLSRELDEGVRNEILKMATINLYIAGQKLRSLDYYIQLKMDNPIVAEPKNIIVIGKYSHYSKYNKSNLQKYLREKKELSVIPFNILLYEAAEEVGVVDLFYRLSKIKDTTDSNYIFMKELDKLVEKIIEKIKESYSNELNNSIGGYASILENNKGKNITFTTYQDGIKIGDSGVSTLYYKEDNKVYTYNNKKEIFGEIGTDFTEEKSKEIISLFHYNDVYGIGNILLDTIDNYINNEFINLVTMIIENTEEDNQILEKYTLNLEYTKDNIYYENMVRAIFTEGNLKSGGFSLYQYEKNKQGKTLSMNIFTASIDYGDRIEFDKSQLN